MADNKLKEILDTATQFEIDAYEFYSKAVEIVKYPSAKELLKEFADIELKHKEELDHKTRTETKYDDVIYIRNFKGV